MNRKATNSERSSAEANRPGALPRLGGGDAGDVLAPVRIISKFTRRDLSKGLLAGMRIRKKLMVLHTFFSLALAVILLLTLRPAVSELVMEAERRSAGDLLRTVADRLASDRPLEIRAALESLTHLQGVDLRSGTAQELGLPAATATEAVVRRGEPVQTVIGESAAAVLFTTSQSPLGPLPAAGETAGPALGDGSAGRYYVLSVRHEGARRALVRVYAVAFVALLGIYALVALALELFVLPQNVYDPIRRMLKADAAVIEGPRSDELIEERHIPRDELGEIMTSRNGTIRELRRQEAALAAALLELERVAGDLKKKNHLIEQAQRNLADADRLVSLGMMSAGLAHELNTPLAVLKGSVEQLNADPRSIDPARAALMLRVVQRLERLGESLLDFARVRPPRSKLAALRPIIDEAATLVRLDRGGRGVTIVNMVPADLNAECDADRMMQVCVNLLRNGVDAIQSFRAGQGSPVGEGRGEAHSEHAGGVIEVHAETLARAGVEWVSLAFVDNGPGIDAEILPRLFEPFASTRLDSRGTGLGLAVAEGIVREHGGVLLARNRPDRGGAVFELTFPRRAPGEAGAGLGAGVGAGVGAGAGQDDDVRSVQPSPDVAGISKDRA